MRCDFHSHSFERRKPSNSFILYYSQIIAAISDIIMSSSEYKLPSNLLDKDLTDTSREVIVLNEGIMGNRAIVISHLLSNDECDAVMQFMNQYDPAKEVSDSVTTEKMVPANSKSEYRNCLRMCATGEEISTELFNRIDLILKQLGEDKKLCSTSNENEFLQDGLGMKGEWRFSSVNSFFRLCKYNPGGHFAPHYDSDFIIDPLGHRSLKTLMIYLNDDYGGGETQFCSEHALYFDKEKRLYCAPEETVHTSWKPRKGDCILFDHRLLHEGAMVTSGEKYIMRSEAMYQLSNEDKEENNEEKQAIRLWYEGCALEAQGDINEAIKRYRRAYKLYPELESRFI